MSEKRLGFVGIVMENRHCAAEVNRVLSLCGEMVKGRIGLPDHERGTAVIGLIVEGNNEQIGAMTGRLGNIPGVRVKSALTAKTVDQKG